MAAPRLSTHAVMLPILALRAPELSIGMPLVLLVQSATPKAPCFGAIAGAKMPGVRLRRLIRPAEGGTLSKFARIGHLHTSGRSGVGVTQFAKFDFFCKGN